MIVGSDERRWAWMDEGFNTFINHYSSLAFYGASAMQQLRTVPSHVVEQSALPIADQPIMTYPDHIRAAGLGFLAYRKPAYGLILLREKILGPERFDAAFREYIRRWAFRHPQPADFFRTIEDVAGDDLGWFWRGWFYTTESVDQAVEAVEANAQESVITLENRAGLVMPAVIAIELADGEEQRIDLPVEIWATSDVYTMPVPGRVTHVTLDPDAVLPDVDRSNNEWRASSAGG